MSRTLSAIFIFGIFGFLEAQQTSPPPQCPATPFHVSEGPGAAFQFTKVDDNLRGEADAVMPSTRTRPGVSRIPACRHISTRWAIASSAAGPRLKRSLSLPCAPRPGGERFCAAKRLGLCHHGPSGSAGKRGATGRSLGHETAHIYERHPYLENRSHAQEDRGCGDYFGSRRLGPRRVWHMAGCDRRTANVSTLLLVESVYGYSREMESQADQRRARGHDRCRIQSSRHGGCFRAARPGQQPRV